MKHNLLLRQLGTIVLCFGMLSAAAVALARPAAPGVDSIEIGMRVDVPTEPQPTARPQHNTAKPATQLALGPLNPTAVPSPTPQPTPAPTAEPRPDATTKAHVNLRVGPGLSYARTAALVKGTAISLQGYHADWYFVKSASGQNGWLQATTLTINPDFDLAGLPLVETAVSESQLLNIYDATTARYTDIFAGPGVDFNVVASHIPPSVHLKLGGRDTAGMWLSLIDKQGAAGWVLASSLQLAPGFPIMALPDLTLPEEEPTLDLVLPVPFEWGGQTHDMGHSAEMIDMGMGWVKVQSKWHDQSKPEDVLGLIRQAHERGFKILLALPGQPYPQSIDYTAYVEFLGGVAALEPAPDAIEVWNEMNTDFEWPVGAIDPAIYVNEMLKPAYRAIKASNPNVMVISGAPAPTGFDDGIHAWADDRYVAGMVQAGARDFVDCVGIHYNAGATSPSAISGHPAGAFYGWYFRPSLDMYFKAFHKPLCITEIGYLTNDDIHTQRMPDNFWWADTTSVEEHAAWLAEAGVLARESGFVRLFIIFSVDIQHWDKRDPQSGYALFRPMGNCPACSLLKEQLGQPATLASK